MRGVTRLSLLVGPKSWYYKLHRVNGPQEDVINNQLWSGSPGVLLFLRSFDDDAFHGALINAENFVARNRMTFRLNVKSHSYHLDLTSEFELFTIQSTNISHAKVFVKIALKSVISTPSTLCTSLTLK